VDSVPAFEDHPVLIMNWPATFSVRASAPPQSDSPPADVNYTLDPKSVVTSASYSNRGSYSIGDPLNPVDPSLATWNRDVFRLLVQLSLQVTADPSSFALPSLLQSH